MARIEIRRYSIGTGGCGVWRLAAKREEGAVTLHSPYSRLSRCVTIVALWDRVNPRGELDCLLKRRKEQYSRSLHR